MRAAILGAGGQLGTALQKVLQGAACPWTRADVDAADAPALRAKLLATKPTHLVNCTAYNFVDKAEHEPEAAYRTNAFAVRDMARLCAELDIAFVHVSTDYVFGLDTHRSRPFAETEAAEPVSVYGASKLAGEQFARAYAPRHLVVRTCGLYGPRSLQGGKGTNFVETMLRLARGGKPLKVIADQHCTPSSAFDAAAGMAHLMEAGASGLYHVVNAGQTTWHDFARTIFAVANVKADLTPTTAAAYAVQFPPEKAPARRPGYSVLSLYKYNALGLPPMPDWKVGLEEYLMERASETEA